MDDLSKYPDDCRLSLSETPIDPISKQLTAFLLIRKDAFRKKSLAAVWKAARGM
jgi:hypothetical protein